jgi:hypothetical protein
MVSNFFKLVVTTGATVGISLISQAIQASAVVINFDDQGLTGPSFFASASPSPQTIPITVGGVTATFNGGVILTNASNLPANQTSIYGTASFGTGLTNPLVISFSQPITNFFLDVLNGNTESINYTVADNNGNSSTFNLIPNTSAGQTQIGFAATGNQVTISSAIGSSTAYDFFIDNIRFNEALPPSLGGTSVPEPFTIVGTLIGAGTAFRMRKRLKVTNKL